MLHLLILISLVSRTNAAVNVSNVEIRDGVDKPWYIYIESLLEIGIIKGSHGGIVTTFLTQMLDQISLAYQWCVPTKGNNYC